MLGQKTLFLEVIASSAEKFPNFNDLLTGGGYNGGIGRKSAKGGLDKIPGQTEDTFTNAFAAGVKVVGEYLDSINPFKHEPTVEEKRATEHASELGLTKEQALDLLQNDNPKLMQMYKEQGIEVSGSNHHEAGQLPAQSTPNAAAKGVEGQQR